MMLTEAVRDYLTVVRITKRPRTLESASYILNEFCSKIPNKPVTAVERRDLLRYMEVLKEQNQSNRTLANKYVRVVAFLQHHGVEIPKAIRRQDRPRFTEGMPEVYEDGELVRFFTACDRRQMVLFKTLLMTGLRKEEIRWLRWSDIEAKTMVHIQPHPPTFIPKTHEERRVPLAAELYEMMAGMDKRVSAMNLIFPTKSGKPYTRAALLIMCKRLAKRAKLDESRFWLHKFRATYCTTLLREGVDLRTVMSLMGHRDIESTMRYLRPLEGDALRKQLASVFGKFSA